MTSHLHVFDPCNLSAIKPLAALATDHETVHQELATDEMLGYIGDIVTATQSSSMLHLSTSPHRAMALLATVRPWS
ncbi:hypothetical protein [Mycobacterium uberis]|uniref:hypothetical protein n=1 Tax=Mycobacterium uberis TaxID=2162698 RepID=UPI001FB3CB01|nr:hypothetical protein [Mycobacterium uberis]